MEEASELQKTVRHLLASAGMNLRKWRTNSAALRETIPVDIQEAGPLTIPTPANTPKALGIHWDVDEDVLHIATPKEPDNPGKVTKRRITSSTAGVFDVLGLFSPAIIPARILIQDLWKMGIGWDDEVPPDISTRWTDWLASLPAITTHTIPRQLSKSDLATQFEALHGFADASQLAYGAAVYIRRVHSDGNTTITLVTAKARVQPVKALTIPRAELTAAHLLARLLAHVAGLLNIPSTNWYAWTDSEIVLHWLYKAEDQLPQFVANRVRSIKSIITPSKWHHVSSKDNPADVASRGMLASQLVRHDLWWHGPPWLQLPPSEWPVKPLRKKPPDTQDVPCLSVICVRDRQANDFITELWERFSSFHTLSRVVAWITRFFLNSKSPPPDRKLTPVLQTVEVRTARLQLMQQECYNDVFSLIHHGKPAPRGHPLRHLTLQLSEDGLITVSSRVRLKKDPTQPVQLILLSAKSRLTKLLVSTLHRSYSHAGIAAMASILGHTYYIPGLRNLLKVISRACPQCQRTYARPLTQQMGLLPAARTTPAPPFTLTGIDFAGPVVLRRGHTRKPVLEKGYVAVFVCLTTKCVHLDICPSLSTEDFLATLRRFVARRGVPKEIYSDNGTNFVGTREHIRELQRLMASNTTQRELSHFTSDQDIKWHMIPPRTPHFGGLWEAAVKSMKTLLHKNVAPHPLRFDEIYTLLTEVEAILNSRPLVPLHSDDVTEAACLTPGHFLIGRPIKALPSAADTKSKTSSLKRWNLVQRLTSEIWKQWLGTYLASCAARTKWISLHNPPKPGDIVFLKNETLPSVRSWPLARVVRIFPGDDGQVRTVEVQCGGKLYVRPTVRLIPLLLEDVTSNPTSPPGGRPRLTGSSTPANHSSPEAALPANHASDVDEDKTKDNQQAPGRMSRTGQDI